MKQRGGLRFGWSWLLQMALRLLMVRSLHVTLFRCLVLPYIDVQFTVDAGTATVCTDIGTCTWCCSVVLNSPPLCFFYICDTKCPERVSCFHFSLCTPVGKEMDQCSCEKDWRVCREIESGIKNSQLGKVFRVFGQLEYCIIYDTAAEFIFLFKSLAWFLLKIHNKLIKTSWS